MSPIESFEPPVFPPWIRWGVRRGASVDFTALPYSESVTKPCNWCGAQCTGRRSRWCSDVCNHAAYRFFWWDSLRQYVYERDGGGCQRCSAALSRYRPSMDWRWKMWQVDHVVPVKDGGNDHPDNLRLLCHDCHVAVGYEQRAARKTQQIAA